MRRTRVKVNPEEMKHIYASKIDMLVDLIQPKDLYLIAGRGTAKTASIMAKRSMRIVESMPASYQVFLSTTYVDALTNIMPALIEGWLRNGWKEGIHFVTDKKPDKKHFKKPYRPPLKYKHTVSMYNGAFFNIGSLDQPSGLAGNSYQHMYGDEARLLKKTKLDKIAPAIRGVDARFMNSPFYGGKTFTTDMPNIMLNDQDWILDMFKEMDQEQIEAALECGLILNDIKREMISNEQVGNISVRARLDKLYRLWYQYWVRARHDSVFAYMASSFHNLDVLSDKFFSNVLTSLGPEEFKSAILSFRVSIEKGQQFYYNLEHYHFFEDGVDNSFYDKYNILDTFKSSSEALRYCDKNMPMEAGVDFGRMMSMVTGQQRGRYLYALKEFYTLPPNNEKELAIQFIDFYKNHRLKKLYLYYDRSGNQNASIKKDFASSLKKEIEYQNGVSTGWSVELMSLNQGTIMQSEEYFLTNKIMQETEKELPVLRIDKYQCKCLKSSIELTKTMVKKDKNGTSTIHKDKSSEQKLSLEHLPMYSTNFSDAFKYWICRRDFMKMVQSRSGGTFIEAGIV